MHHDIKLLRKNWKPSAKKKPKESSYKHVCAGMNTGKKARSIFLIWRKEITPKKHIQKLFISGVIKTDPFCQERFYRDLYKSKTNDPEISQKISAFLIKRSKYSKTIWRTAKATRRSISSEECFCVLNSFDQNKTPGNDGIPVEFYKTFWAALKDSFIKCVNECFEKRWDV